MFWNKKEDGKSLPDLPPIKSPFSKELAVSTENKKMVEDKLDEMDDDEESDEKHSLPAFPDSPMNRGFSQSAIKEAVNQEDLKNEESDDSQNSAPEEPKSRFKTVEMEDDKEPQSIDNPYLASIKSESIPKQKVSYVEQTNSYNSPVQNKKNPFLLTPPPIEREEVEQVEERVDRIDRALPQKSNDVFVKIEKFYSAKKSLEAIKEQIDQIDELLKKIRDVKLKEERELSIWEKEIALVKSRIQNVNETIFEKL